MVALYVIVTIMIIFPIGIVAGWYLHIAHLDFVNRVTTALANLHANYDNQETP